MIRIQNIYYMLAYAFQVLHEQGYRSIATEGFNNTANLCAEILIRGLGIQIKRGLCHDYIQQTEQMSTIRGRIDISESIRSQSLRKNQIVCIYDKFSVNSNPNRIIKSTILRLIRSDIAKTRKKNLRKLLIYFNDVEEIDLNTTNWTIQYNSNNQTYRMLISICHLIIKGLLQTQTDGTHRLMEFFDEQRMHRLYEKFILEYYRQEYPQITANASQILWQLDDDVNEMLPVMNTDIMLIYGEKVLIIDAKYYAHSTQIQYNKHTLHSDNVYQIFTYVKNKEIELTDRPHEVSGLLLYAATDEDIQPDNCYRMSGNKISVRTLDLNCDFDTIKKQLNAIVEEHFGISSNQT